MPDDSLKRNNASKTYTAFGGIIAIGGANFIAVSFSNLELPPLFGAALRFGMAAFIFLLIALLLKVPMARGRSAVGAAVYGLLGFGCTYALLYYALVALPAGTVAVIVAATPLCTLVIAILIGQEKLSKRGVVGGFLAITGIAVLSRGAIANDFGLGYFVAAVLGTLAAAASSVVAKSFPDVHPINMNAIGMTAGTIFLAAGSWVLNESWALPREGRTLMAVGWLVLVGSVGLFQLFLYVLKSWTASATVYAIAAMPVVAVGLGAVLLAQPITLEVVVGGALVMIAVYVGAISQDVKSKSKNP